MNKYINSPLTKKSRALAKDVVKYTDWMRRVKTELIISDQLKRAGLSVAANVSESLSAESAKDMLHKLRIALKEARECESFMLVANTDRLFHPESYPKIDKDLNEVISLLVASTRKLREQVEKKKRGGEE